MRTPIGDDHHRQPDPATVDVDVQDNLLKPMPLSHDVVEILNPAHCAGPAEH